MGVFLLAKSKTQPLLNPYSCIMILVSIKPTDVLKDHKYVK